MLRITIDLISAITGKIQTTGCMYIANDGKGSLTKANYIAAICKRGDFGNPPMELFNNKTKPISSRKAARTGRIDNYPRLAYNVWRLVSRALLATFPEEAAPNSRKNITSLVNSEVMEGARKVLEEFKGEMDSDIEAFSQWVKEGEHHDD